MIVSSKSHRILAAIAIALAIAVGVVAAYRSRKSAETPPSAAVAKPTAVAPTVAERQAPAHIAAPPPAVSPPAAPPDYERELRESQDVLVLAEKLYVLARQGDAAAQYALSLALEYCGSTYTIAFKNIFDDAEPELTLEEALAKEAQHPFLGADGVVALQRKCRRYREKDQSRFGSSFEWLYASANGRFPRAQATVAIHKAIDIKEKRNPGQEDADRAESFRLAIDALRDGDPAVVMSLGVLAQGFNSPHPLLGDETWSWALAACRRGFDCSAQASWVQAWCRDEGDCEPNMTGEDFMRRKAGERFEAWERRAAEVNLAIDEKRWDDLGF